VDLVSTVFPFAYHTAVAHIPTRQLSVDGDQEKEFAPRQKPEHHYGIVLFYKVKIARWSDGFRGIAPPVIL